MTMLRRDRWVAAALVGSTLALAWGLTFAAGLIGVPRTDDWGFAREAYSLHGGHLRLINWGPMTKIGLLLWAQPFLWIFGDHHWAVALSVSVLVAVGLVSAFVLARLRVGTLRAAAAVAVLLVFPGVVRDTASFMTDPPALALQLVTLALGGLSLRAEGRRRVGLFAAALLVGLWAFSIRELAVAAPLAVIVAAYLAEADRQWRARVAAGGAVLVAAAGAIWLWHHGLAGVEAYRGHPALSSSLILVASCTITVALALAPALAISVPRWWHTRHRVGRTVGAAMGVAVVAARPLLAHHAHAKNWWLVGDYLQADGINGEKMLLGFRPTVLNEGIWHVLIGVACVSTVLCAALLGEWFAGWATPSARIARPDVDPVARLVGIHAGFAALALVVAGVWNGALFDRYTWPLIFSASLTLLWRAAASEPSARAIVGSQIAGTVAVVLALGVCAMITVNSAAFDAARWHAAQNAVRSGTPANEVDGGVEWDGYHSTAVDLDGTSPIADPLVSWWSHMTAMPKVCIVLTASPVDSRLGNEVGTFRWRTWLVTGDATLHIYRLVAPACP